jgi:hypothetical protein
MKHVIAIFFLTLLWGGSATAVSLPMAPINQASQERIAEILNANADAFRAEIAMYSALDPRRGVAQARFLNYAFTRAGYSFDKTFYAWLTKVANGPEVRAYPELYAYGIDFGFREVMLYLVEMGPESRYLVSQTGVYSPATLELSKRMISPAQKAKYEAYEAPVDLGNVKADSYEACMEENNPKCM